MSKNAREVVRRWTAKLKFFEKSLALHRARYAMARGWRALWTRRLRYRSDRLEYHRTHATSPDLVEKWEILVEEARRGVERWADRVDHEHELIERRKRQIAASHRVLKRWRRKLGKRVRRPHERVVMNVRNRSSRGGADPHMIVLHSTEGDNIPGDGDLIGLGRWFDNPAAQASSHVAVDAEGRSARYVKDHEKAWTQAAYNPQALSIEQVAYAAQGSWPDAQLHKVAQYIAYWSKKYGIPIRHGIPGVVRHSDLGSSGGGHHDPGKAYPLARVLKLAREYRENGW